MNQADAYAVVDRNGELVVTRITKLAAEQMRDSFYPGCSVIPLRLVSDNDETRQEFA